MSDQGKPMAEPTGEITERRQRVDHQSRPGRWRKGRVEASESVRRRLARPEPDGRASARVERRWSSRSLHRLGEITSHSGAGLVVVGLVLVWLVVGWIKAFPTWWQATLYATSSSITLVMVFAIQHTQARQQAAIQRKLDETLRSIAEADDRLIAVEEAPDEELEARADLNIEDRNRAAP